MDEPTFVQSQEVESSETVQDMIMDMSDWIDASHL